MLDMDRMKLISDFVTTQMTGESPEVVHLASSIVLLMTLNRVPCGTKESVRALELILDYNRFIEGLQK